jgi:hypothetical protein
LTVTELQLDLAEVQADVERDEDDRPLLTIWVGAHTLVFSADQDDEGLAGIRRIVEAAWNYSVATKTRALTQRTVPSAPPAPGEISDPGNSGPGF